MRSLILDQSTTKAGWALLDSGKLIDHGRITVKGEVRDRVKELLKDVTELINLFKPSELVVEDTGCIRQMSKATNHAMAGMLWKLQDLAEDHYLKFYAVNPSSIKIQMTGKGNAKKEEMIEAVRLRTGIEPMDDNHADAIAGALCWAIIGDEHRRKRA